jgi:hypothetical protein
MTSADGLTTCEEPLPVVFPTALLPAGPLAGLTTLVSLAVATGRLATGRFADAFLAGALFFAAGAFFLAATAFLCRSARSTARPVSSPCPPPP